MNDFNKPHVKTILRQTADADSFRYIVEKRHLNDAADYIEQLESRIQSTDSELASLRSEVEKLKAQLDERTLQHKVQLDNAVRLDKECRDKESEIQRLWERVKSLLSENERAHKHLLDLQDRDMPESLPGAVEYIIDHSNEGWTRVGEQEKEIERLKAENAALREGWEASFKEGWHEGVNVPRRNYGMTVDGNVESDWEFSDAKQRLEQIGKGEG